MPLLCQLMYIDFEGRSDGRSMKAILSHLNPRKVILINGNTQSKEEMRLHCVKNDIKEVFIPMAGQCIDISAETNLVRVTLSEQLLSAVRFLNVHNTDYDIAYVQGKVRTNYAKNNLPLIEAAC